MSVIAVTTSPAPTTSGDTEVIPFNSDLVVSAGVTIINEDTSTSSAAIFDNGDSRAIISGAITAYTPIVFAQTSSSYSYLTIASTGSVMSFDSGYDIAIEVESGQFNIVNNGEIQGVSYLDDNAPAGSVAGSGGGVFDNNGTINTTYYALYNNSASGSTVHIDNTGAITATGSTSVGATAIDDFGGHTVYLNNSGTISASGNGTAIYTDSITTEYFTNSGHIVGDVDLNDTASTFSNSGIIDGNVFFSGSTFIENGAINGIATLSGGAATTNVSIGAAAVISNGNMLGYNLRITQGPFYVSNSGDVGGLAVDYNFGNNTPTSGAGSIVNHGTIATRDDSHAALYIGDTAVGDVNTVDNFGAILGDTKGGSSRGVTSVLAALDVVNQGSITGIYAVFFGGSGNLNNSGTLVGGVAGVYSLAGAGGDDYVFNSGSISGDDAIFDTGGHTARIVNYGTLSAGTASGDCAVFADVVTKERLVNGGTISGAVSLGAASSTIVNSGSIDGNIAFGGGSGRFVNSGSVDGNISFTGTGNVYLGKGGSFTGTLTGTGNDGRYYAGAGVENFDFTAAGAATAVGGTGETTFDYGANYTNSMAIQGGSGTTIVDLEGNYIGNAKAIFLGARAMVGVDKIVFGAGFSYSLSVNAATVENGATMTVDASAVGTGQTATLNISKDVGGFYDFIGGVGADTIVCAANNLFANDVLLGGTSLSNQINFKTAGTVLSQSFGNVSGFSTINLVSGTNDIQLNDVMVTKANASHALAVNLSTGDDIIDSSLLITSTNVVTVNAQNASGGDTFIFGAAKETVNLGAGVSTSVNYDTIANFNFGAGSVFDALTVAGYNPAANMIDATVSGTLSTASFDADLATALAGHLNNGDALLFTANGGTLAGDTFLIASTNGSAGYSAGDLVVRLTGTTTGTLAVGNV